MPAEQRIVDNRVFLLGLDGLYRYFMKKHERGELLGCARRVAEAIDVTPADVPIEGYYAEDEKLTAYFRLVRALQVVDGSATSLVDSLPEFQRLRDVTSAPLFGQPQYNGMLLPVGHDALSQALLDTFPKWTVAGLTEAAGDRARETDDISLVGLAARIQDPVVLATVRESVVLYAESVLGAALHPPPPPQYVWQVDEDLAKHAGKFIDTFNKLFGNELPPPVPAQVKRYWHAYDDNSIFARCVRLGMDDSVSPVRHYHWAISRTSKGVFEVEEFWKPEAWTTSRYRQTLGGMGWHPKS